MSDTTEAERYQWRKRVEWMKSDGYTGSAISFHFLDRFLNDADRLAAIERGIKSMVEDYEFYDDEGVRARDTAKHLRAILDPEKADGS